MPPEFVLISFIVLIVFVLVSFFKTALLKTKFDFSGFNNLALLLFLATTITTLLFFALPTGSFIISHWKL